MTAEVETDWAAAIGKPAYESIVDMVAALECDYDRLEELRDERDGWESDENSHCPAPDVLPTWATDHPDDAEELAELEAAAGECESQDDAQTRIQEDALSVEIRSGWVTCSDDMTAEEFCILLSTGGPAVRILGVLDEHGEPDRAWLEVQDWFKPWTEYVPADQDTLLAYARQFVYVS